MIAKREAQKEMQIAALAHLIDKFRLERGLASNEIEEIYDAAIKQLFKNLGWNKNEQ
jgi:hypothetical protein